MVSHRGRFRLLVIVGLFAACSDSLLTSPPPEGESFDAPLDVSPGLLASFARGDEQFERIFTISDGLGPLFNQPSCETCHPGDGRGSLASSLTRFSIGGDLVPELGGPQRQNRAIPGVEPETIPAGAETSDRTAPAVFGMGLIEGIPVATLEALEDPSDADGDGISGRINFVEAADFVPQGTVGAGPGLAVGRFGRKANISSLREQVANAYQQDMGITTDFRPDEPIHPGSGVSAIADNVPDPEVPAFEVVDVVIYVRLLAPPARGPSTAESESGGVTFEQIGCAGCHVPFLTTGPNAIPALDRQEARMYSDLLLHDMGPGLADGRGDGTANGFEWRTAPLWGLRLVGDPLGGEAIYLHDGRATTVDEAIRLHGGEAAAAQDRYVGLSEGERDNLLAYLNTL